LLYFTRAKTYGILLLCLLGLLLGLPNLSARPGFLPAFLPWSQVHLGLDLRGGSYLLLQLDFAAVEKQDLATIMDQARQAMRAADLGYTGLAADTENNDVQLHLLNPGEQPAAMAALQKLITYTENNTPALAIDNGPDNSLILSIPRPALAARRSQAIASSGAARSSAVSAASVRACATSGSALGGRRLR